jgi:hypothetical protein
LLRKSRACGAQDRWSTALTTGPFLPLVSHYLFDSDFARVGQEHDNGGVESRGKPIPRGDSASMRSHASGARSSVAAHY